MRSPQTKSIFRHGVDNTRRGLLRKLPLFFFAGAAVFILTQLDGVKTNYELVKGSAGRSLEISDDFIEKLETEAQTEREKTLGRDEQLKRKLMDETMENWLRESYRFKYQKFANHRALLDALAGKARVAKDEGQALLEKTKAETQERNSKLGEELKARNVRSDRRAAIYQITVAGTQQIGYLDAHIVQLEPALRERTEYVYTTFSRQLPKVLLNVQGRQPGMLDELMTPILNEQSSLNVVYHVFRLTALIILILSFVFILVMLIQHSPFSGETETVSGQLRTLFSIKAAGVGGEIAKTAIISVTALGVGTAVFVGATAPDTAAVSRAANTNPAGLGTVRERFRDVLFPDPGGQIILDPVADEYFRQTFFSERNRNSYFYDLRQLVSPQPSPLEFSPTILPAPIEVRTVVVPGGNSQALLNELTRLVRTVNSATDLTPIRNQIDALRLEIDALKIAAVNKPDCQCKDAINAIAEKIDALNATIGGTPKPNPTTSPSPSPSTTLPPNVSPTPTPTPPPPSILSTLKTTADALDAIDKDLKAMRADNLIKLGSSRKNLATRVGQLFVGSKYYFVSEQTYLALQAFLQGNPHYDAFTTALTKMKMQPPLKKNQFLRTLRNFLMDSEQKALKPLEKEILNHARLDP